MRISTSSIRPPMPWPMPYGVTVWTRVFRSRSTGTLSRSGMLSR
jgi:hypothetical protein